MTRRIRISISDKLQQLMYEKGKFEGSYKEFVLYSIVPVQAQTSKLLIPPNEHGVYNVPPNVFTLMAIEQLELSTSDICEGIQIALGNDWNTNLLESNGSISDELFLCKLMKKQIQTHNQLLDNNNQLIKEKNALRVRNQNLCNTVHDLRHELNQKVEQIESLQLHYKAELGKELFRNTCKKAIDEKADQAYLSAREQNLLDQGYTRIEFDDRIHLLRYRTFFTSAIKGERYLGTYWYDLKKEGSIQCIYFGDQFYSPSK